MRKLAVAILTIAVVAAVAHRWIGHGEGASGDATGGAVTSGVAIRRGTGESPSRAARFGPAERMEVTSRRVPGEYVAVTKGNLAELVSRIPLHGNEGLGSNAPGCEDLARRLAEVLVGALALDEFTDPELDSVLSHGTPLRMRGELEARRRSSPNLFWESINVGASKLVVLPLTTSATQAIPGFHSRPIPIVGMDRTPPLCLLLLSFEFEHYGRARGGTGPACNKATFEFVHDPGSGETTLIGVVQSNVLELPPPVGR